MGVEGHTFSTSLEYSYESLQTIERIKYPVNVVMEERPTTEQVFASFWEAYGGLISFVGAGFAAGFSTILVGRFSRPKAH
jgi:hypothetical protein